MAGTVGSRAWTSKACGICGATFTVKAADGTKTCRPECAREWAKLKRKRTSSRAWRSLVLSLLFERDGDGCGVCGGLIDPQADGDLAPSVDHVIPLSRGGNHDGSNLQLTHLKCNVEKSDS